MPATDRDAELVALAMKSGPDMAEFCSDYVTMLEPPLPPRSVLADEIAHAWGERALDDLPLGQGEEASDDAYADIVSNAKPQIEYYLP